MRRLIVVVWLAVGAGLVGLAVLFTPALYRPLEWLLRGRGRIETLLVELVTMADSYRRRLGTVAAMLALAVGIHSLYVIAFYLMSRAIFPAGLPSLGSHFLMVPLTLFTTAVPLPFGALGVSENACRELFRLVGHPGGAVAMMAYRVLMYAGGAVSIVVYLASLRLVRDLETVAESDTRAEPGLVPAGS